jgi:hypothetical protein
MPRLPEASIVARVAPFVPNANAVAFIVPNIDA